MTEITEILNQSIPYLKRALSENQFLEGGAILGFLAVVARYMKDLVIFLWDRLSRRVTFSASFQEHSYPFEALNYILSRDYSDSPRNVEIRTTWEGSKRKPMKVLFQDLFLIWYQRVPIIVHATTRELDGNMNSDHPIFKTVNIKTFFFKKKLHKFINYCIDEWQMKQESEERSCIYFSSQGGWRYIGELPKRSISTVIGENVDFLYDDLSEFVKSKKWYTDRGIPYKRGYLLYGPPGNGKTSLCKALASEFNIDILILNLADLNDGNANDTIASISEVAKGDTPSMVVIEDVDSFVEGRIVKKKGLSFSTLLNIFDGIISSEGTILFLTTNIVENLDPALIRPGRIDIKAEISNPREKDIQKYLERFYEKEFEEITFEGVSMSQVQECCVQHKDSPKDAVSQLQELCNEL